MARPGSTHSLVSDVIESKMPAGSETSSLLFKKLSCFPVFAAMHAIQCHSVSLIISRSGERRDSTHRIFTPVRLLKMSAGRVASWLTCKNLCATDSAYV